MRLSAARSARVAVSLCALVGLGCDSDLAFDNPCEGTGCQDGGGGGVGADAHAGDVAAADRSSPDGAADAKLADGAVADGPLADGIVPDGQPPDGLPGDASVADGLAPDVTGDAVVPDVEVDGPSGDGPGPDHAPPDGALPEDGSLDALGPDLALPPDASLDGPPPDVPQPDAPLPDGPLPDVPSPDAPLPDGPPPDGPAPDAGPPEPDCPLPEDLPEGWVCLLPALVELGNVVDDPNAGDDEAGARVQLRHPLLVADTEVTQAEWMEVTGDNPAHFSPAGDGACLGDPCDTRPVERVSFHEAVAYANARSGADACYLDAGADPYDFDDAAAAVDPVWTGPDCVGLRLPTEAEWVYAARGTQPSNAAGGAWLVANANGRTHPTGDLAPNDVGLSDVLGNVAEWTWDRYAVERAGGIDPTGPEAGGERTIRGGAYDSDTARPSARTAVAPETRSPAIGLRLVRSRACRPVDETCNHLDDDCDGVADEGCAPAELVFEPDEFRFPETAAGDATEFATLRLRNAGDIPAEAVTVVLGGEHPEDFTLVGGDDACEDGQILDAGATCTLRVTFGPTWIGERGALLVARGRELEDATADLSGPARTRVATGELVGDPILIGGRNGRSVEVTPGGDVWIVTDESLVRLDRFGVRVGGPWVLADTREPSIALDPDGTVWVASGQDDVTQIKLWHIDPEVEEVPDPLVRHEAGSWRNHALAVAVRADEVWIAGQVAYQDNRLDYAAIWRVGRDANAIGAPLRFDGHPMDVGSGATDLVFGPGGDAWFCGSHRRNGDTWVTLWRTTGAGQLVAGFPNDGDLAPQRSAQAVAVDAEGNAWLCGTNAQARWAVWRYDAAAVPDDRFPVEPGGLTCAGLVLGPGDLAWAVGRGVEPGGQERAAVLRFGRGGNDQNFQLLGREVSAAYDVTVDASGHVWVIGSSGRSNTATVWRLR